MNCQCQCRAIITYEFAAVTRARVISRPPLTRVDAQTSRGRSTVKMTYDQSENMRSTHVSRPSLGHYLIARNGFENGGI